MRFAYFPGCKIPYFLPQYDQSARAVFTTLGVGLEDLEFDCCGYPVRHQSAEAALYSAAKVMATAVRDGYRKRVPEIALSPEESRSISRRFFFSLYGGGSSERSRV